MEITDIDSLSFTTSEKRLVKKTILDNPYIPIKPFKRQLVALLLANKLDESPVDIMFGGAAGGAKTSTLSMLAAQYLGEPEYRCLVMRENYKDLVSTNSIFDNLKSWVRREELGSLKCKVRETSPIRIKAPSGAEIHFNSFDDLDSREKMRGEEYQRILVDEMTQIPKGVLTYRYRSLRRTTDSWIPLSTIGGTNPNYSETNDYVTEKYVLPNAPCVYLPMSFKHNPHINTEEYTKQLLQLDPIDIEYQLRGNFLYKPKAGDLISRDEMESQIVNADDMLLQYSLVGIDLAGKGKDKFAVCRYDLLMNGLEIIQDFNQTESPNAEDLLINFIMKHNPNPQFPTTRLVVIEQEGGGSPEYARKYFQDLLSDFNIPVVLKPPKGSKYQRARPLMRLIKNGQVKLNKDALFLEEFIDESIRLSPDGKGKSPNLVDSTTLVHNYLHQEILRSQTTITTGVRIG